MKLATWTASTLLAIATLTATQFPAFSQGTFRTPTHPTLSEFSSSPSTPALLPAVSAESAIDQGQTTQSQFFSHVPQLIRTVASQKSARTPSTYEFTIVVPQNAGKALKAVRINQAPNLETVSFDVAQSQAFAGGRYAAGPKLELASIGGAQPASGEVTVVFNQPVQPGQTVTIALEANSNPNGGIYEFGVTAFPDGNNESDQFLGYGRISFYTGSN